MYVSLTEFDSIRVRRHLGYPGMDTVFTFQHSIPAGLQTAYAVNDTLVHLTPDIVPHALRWVDECDRIECEYLSNMDLANVESFGSIKVNRERSRELAEGYLMARQNLANLLGVVPNPFDQRAWISGASGMYCGRISQ